MEGTTSTPRTIPRPLVNANRVFLVMTVGAALLLQPLILLLPLGVGLIALITGWNPVIRIGRRYLQKNPEEYRQADPADQRFNQWIATTLIASAGISFLLGYPVAGFIFGGMVLLAAAIALAGFCVGCYLRFKVLQFRYHREQ